MVIWTKCVGVFAALMMTGASGVRGVTISFTPVSNPGNAADTTGFGAVGYSYSIGTYDVTNNQYIEFLNVKDQTGADPLGLYASGMGSANGGIRFTAGNPTGSKYAAIAGRGNWAVNYITWYDAVRFVNWLGNGQGNGDTESGAYTLLGGTPVPSNAVAITRNAGATIVLPSENEWYKGAYYNPGTSSYFQYPTSSNVLPAASVPSGGSNEANYGNVVAVPTDVGSYPNSASPYGTFDQGGELFQWVDSPESPPGNHGLRGGSFDSNASALLSSTELITVGGGSIAGFRVASVPEPAMGALLAVGWWLGIVTVYHPHRRSG